MATAMTVMMMVGATVPETLACPRKRHLRCAAACRLRARQHDLRHAPGHGRRQCRLGCGVVEQQHRGWHPQQHGLVLEFPTAYGVGATHSSRGHPVRRQKSPATQTAWARAAIGSECRSALQHRAWHVCPGCHRHRHRRLCCQLALAAGRATLKACQLTCIRARVTALPVQSAGSAPWRRPGIFKSNVVNCRFSGTQARTHETARMLKRGVRVAVLIHQIRRRHRCQRCQR